MRRIVLTAAVAALLIAGCSKSEETTTGASSTTAGTTPATAAPTTEKEAPATTARKRATTTTEDDGPTTSVEPKNPDSEYCAEAKKTVEVFAEADAVNPMEDPQAFSDFLASATGSAEDMADVSPDEIKAEWEAIAEAFGTLAAVPPAQLMDELTRMGDTLDEAGQSIDEFTLAECGFDMDGETGSGSGSSTDDGTGATTETTEK